LSAHLILSGRKFQTRGAATAKSLDANDDAGDDELQSSDAHWFIVNRLFVSNETDNDDSK